LFSVVCALPKVHVSAQFALSRVQIYEVLAGLQGVGRFFFSVLRQEKIIVCLSLKKVDSQKSQT
jgi:hypothetical protein